MRQLTLLAIPDCPLSAHARQVLDALAADGLLAWGEVSTGTPNGEALQRNAPDLLPSSSTSPACSSRTAGSPSEAYAARSLRRPKWPDRRHFPPAARPSRRAVNY